MRKRFAIVIGLAAAGVMALGAQTAAAAAEVVKYDTKLTLRLHNHDRFIGWIRLVGSEVIRPQRLRNTGAAVGADELTSSPPGVQVTGR